MQSYFANLTDLCLYIQFVLQSKPTLEVIEPCKLKFYLSDLKVDAKLNWIVAQEMSKQYL